MRIADEIESGNLRVTSRNNRNFGHPEDQKRMRRSAKLAAIAHPHVRPSEVQTELIRRGWERRDAVQIASWFSR